MTQREQIIYMDYNATTPVHPKAIEAMLPYLGERFGNPSSGHAFGVEARRAVGEAREQVAALLGCGEDEILFTSGGTEANNLAIRGAFERAAPSRRVVTSAVEHPATARPCDRLEREGALVTRVPVERDGRVCVEAAREAMRGDTALVTVMLAQNETGAIMPLARLADLARSHGAIVHTDAAQAVGKIPTRVDDLGVDLLSIAGHKLYAPKGVGALYVRRGTALAPVLLGAGHERGLRPGTENVASVVALGRACEIAAGDMAGESEKVSGLRDALFCALVSGVPGLTLNGPQMERLPNTLNVSFPGVRGSAVLANAPEIAASTGSACHAGAESPSGVLLAMGIVPDLALGAVRLSLGRGTTPAEVDLAARALVRAFQAARGEAG